MLWPIPVGDLANTIQPTNDFGILFQTLWRVSVGGHLNHLPRHQSSNRRLPSSQDRLNVAARPDKYVNNDARARFHPYFQQLRSRDFDREKDSINVSHLPLTYVIVHLIIITNDRTAMTLRPRGFPRIAGLWVNFRVWSL